MQKPGEDRPLEALTRVDLTAIPTEKIRKLFELRIFSTIISNEIYAAVLKDSDEVLLFVKKDDVFVPLLFSKFSPTLSGCDDLKRFIIDHLEDVPV